MNTTNCRENEVDVKMEARTAAIVAATFYERAAHAMLAALISDPDYANKDNVRYMARQLEARAAEIVGKSERRSG